MERGMHLNQRWTTLSRSLPSLGQEWRNCCNFMIQWMQLLDLSVCRTSFIWDICCVHSLCHTAMHTLVVISHTLNISWHGSCKLAFLKWLYIALKMLCIFLILAMLLVAGEVLLQLKMPTTTSVYVKINHLNQIYCKLKSGQKRYT